MQCWHTAYRCAHFKVINKEGEVIKLREVREGVAKGREGGTEESRSEHREGRKVGR